MSRGSSRGRGGDGERDIVVNGGLNGGRVGVVGSL